MRVEQMVNLRVDSKVLNLDMKSVAQTAAWMVDSKAGRMVAQTE
jgi:hypothetical protein